MNIDGSITDVPGIKVGHAQDFDAMTGCTVVLCEEGAVGGIDQRGGAPGTRQTDAMYPMHLVQHVNAVVLSGGSAFGLDSAAGVVRFLEERGVGFDVRVARVPIVPAAILFDLSIGRPDIRPDATMGYKACLDAGNSPPASGNVGAGTGATVGKILGIEWATKSGIGTASIDLGGGVVVGAIAAVNAFGDVIHPNSGEILAGARNQIDSPSKFCNTMTVMREMAGKKPLAYGAGEHTVIGVVATNAKLTKEHTSKIAQMAHDGLARTIRPAHTMLDGDTIFALSMGDIPVDVNVIGAFSAEAFQFAILNAIKYAEPAAGLPAASTFR